MSLDEELMARAVAVAARARLDAPPNPWVGALVVADGVVLAEGATQAPGGHHAEVEALAAAGERARGATLVVTLEPCDHVGRTGACTEAILAAGISRVVVGIVDPDEKVAGRGIEHLRAAGLEVSVGAGADLVSEQLAAYLWHRRTGRPFVVLKVAATLDGVIAMADGSSQWITGEPARADAHELRAQSQAIIVGAATVRSDDPRLTARLGDRVIEPLRVVLGTAPPTARVHPCLEYFGELVGLLDELGERGVLQALVEGGATVTSSFFSAGLVNRVAWYVAPAFAGARGTRAALTDLSTPTIDALRRGRVVGVRRIGEDVRLDVEV
ncbi:MAG TPA: bifunctional diaminohydroxyphosphoribosylaminopyrimidine deaminase/5-amino-6-(5-phosphoribosylamino)uracil reductase RibD [Acidimicrobiales bacterium]|nr:bifunctional diaminohydroxyphosphoribosylaminopyrimidine deaminase/5-amino-6-(5-phosphoribosylamino)uracil reductase RibD [Acidimicrobiales bacterium]